MQLNDPQVWTLIGLFAATMLGGMTLMTNQLSRVMRAEVSRIDGTLSARIERLDGTLSARIDGLDARVGRVESKIDDLDRELKILAMRFWRSQ